MPTMRMVEYGEASPEVRAVYDDIMATRKTDWVNNFWKALAVHPPTLQRIWEYCINSHIASARKQGLDDEMLAEALAVVGLANETNRLANGYQVEVDERFRPRG